jgi:outer membrane receptor protein involved in Fe transport
MAFLLSAPRSVRAALFVISFLPAFSQTPTAEIKLTVKDPSGAAVAATGKLENMASGVSRGFQADVNGTADLTNVAPGRYRLEVSHSGFTTSSEVIDLQPSALLTREVTLSVGASSFNLNVVEATPLAGFDVPVNNIPAPVQSASAEELHRSGSLDLADFLNKRLAGVNVNESQENPYQPDVNYRGYAASPLLGTPEGVSVFMDGVRMNQPFGDVVSWDLIPKVAIQQATLMPGSNPLFGLNTLGGALAVQTKDGNSQPGTSITVTGGSNNRRAVEMEYGGSNKGSLNWYLAGNIFHDDGWRPLSPSDVRQSFAHLGWQGSKTSVGLSLSYSYNDLWGHGPQEQRLLATDYASGYTLSDETFNRSPFFNATVRHALTSHVTFSGNAYFRYILSDTFNTDFNSDSLSESMYQPTPADQAALTKAGYTGFPTSGANSSNTPFPYWRCIAQVLQYAEPAEKCDAFLTRSWTKQSNYGAAGQLTWSTTRGRIQNQFTPGFAVDHSSLDFKQNQQFAYINPDRTMTGVNGWADGSTNVNGVPFDTRVDLHGNPGTWSLFAADSMTAGKWTLTASGRYNRATVDNLDRLEPAGGPGSLTGKYVFSRLNPAAGVTFTPVASVNAYFSYNEGSRAPTSIELGCADPNNPCHLPNSLVSDPALRQVVTRTLEAGLRGTPERNLNWSVNWFRAGNWDDLLFVASPLANNGYFKNFGKTRRQGATVDVNGRIGHFDLGGDYTFVDATYQSPETIFGAANSTNDAGTPGVDGNIQIQPGNRIPNIPHHMLKVFAGWQVSQKFFVGADLNAHSSSFGRGNDNNLDQPDGVHYFGNGIAPGYAVIDFSAHYQLRKHMQLFANIDNLLNRHYYTGATLAITGITPQGTYLARPFPPTPSGDFPQIYSTFLSPGAPFAVQGGMKVSF